MIKILNEAGRSQTYYIHDDNWYDNKGAYAFYYERNDGVRMYKPINIGKSLVKMGSRRNRITSFEIPDWVLKKKLGTGFRLIQY